MTDSMAKHEELILDEVFKTWKAYHEVRARRLRCEISFWEATFKDKQPEPEVVLLVDKLRMIDKELDEAGKNFKRALVLLVNDYRGLSHEGDKPI